MGVRVFLYCRVAARCPADRAAGRQAFHSNPSSKLVCLQFRPVLWPFQKIHNPFLCCVTFCFCLLRFIQVFGQFFDISKLSICCCLRYTISSLTSESILPSFKVFIAGGKVYNIGNSNDASRDIYSSWRVLEIIFISCWENWYWRTMGCTLWRAICLISISAYVQYLTLERLPINNVVVC